MRSKWILILLTALLLVLSQTNTSHVDLSLAQDATSPLPADLIFTVPGSSELNWWDQPSNTLVRVDAQTLQITPFYIEQADVGRIWALSWSPQGDRLAFYRLYSDPSARFFPRELCVMDANGNLQSCMIDRPPMYLAYATASEDYWVQWSEDGQRLYFVAERITSDTASDRMIVEADVSTGQTLQTLYNYPYDVALQQIPSALTWTTNSNTVLVGAGDSWENRQLSSQPVMLVDLATGSELHINQLMSENQSLSYVCPHFSPDGTYIAAHAFYNLDEYNPWDLNIPGLHQFYQLLIIDQQGQIVFSLGEPTTEDTVQYWGCPTWQPDEQAFYIVGFYLDTEQMAVFKYTLETQELVEYISISPEDSSKISPPLILAPDGEYLAFDAPIAVGSEGQRVVRILAPTGDLIQFDNVFYSTSPVWIPTVDSSILARNFLVGDQAVVHVDEGNVLYIYNQASTQGDPLAELANGTEITLLEGPYQADGYNWWRIQTSEGIEGWAVAGVDNIQTLVPVS